MKTDNFTIPQIKFKWIIKNVQIKMEAFTYYSKDVYECISNGELVVKLQ